MLQLSELELGAIYEINGRNFVIGVWTGGEGFMGIITQYGKEVLGYEQHYDRGSPIGTAQAVRRIGSYICPAPWGNETLMACLDAAEHLWFELRDYKTAADLAGLELVDSKVRSETKTFKEKEK